MKLYLSEEDVLAMLPMRKAVELVETAFHQLADGTAVNHPRRRVILPTGSVLHYMAAGMPGYFRNQSLLDQSEIRRALRGSPVPV